MLLSVNSMLYRIIVDAVALNLHYRPQDSRYHCPTLRNDGHPKNATIAALAHRGRSVRYHRTQLRLPGPHLVAVGPGDTANCICVSCDSVSTWLGWHIRPFLCRLADGPSDNYAALHAYVGIRRRGLAQEA